MIIELSKPYSEYNPYWDFTNPLFSGFPFNFPYGTSIISPFSRIHYYSSFIDKMKEGVVLYIRPLKKKLINHKHTFFYRFITSLRVLTRTTK